MDRFTLWIEYNSIVGDVDGDQFFYRIMRDSRDMTEIFFRYLLNHARYPELTESGSTDLLKSCRLSEETISRIAQTNCRILYAANNTKENDVIVRE